MPRDGHLGRALCPSRCHTHVSRWRMGAQSWVERGLMFARLLEELEHSLFALVPMESLPGQELSKRLGEEPVVGDELAIIAGELEKPTRFGCIGGHGPAAHHAGLVHIGGDSLIGDDLAHVLDAWLGKNALGGLGI